jgi:magnesium-transporting ATPase (P-type)
VCVRVCACASVHVVNVHMIRQVLDQLARGLRSTEEGLKLEGEEMALIIDGKALSVLLVSHHAELLRLGTACHAVICCRVSPLQKALVTRYESPAMHMPNTLLLFYSL